MVNRSIEAIINAVPEERQAKLHGLPLLKAAQEQQDLEYLHAKDVFPFMDALVNHLCRESAKKRQPSDVDIIAQLERGALKYQWETANPQTYEEVLSVQKEVLGVAVQSSIAINTTSREHTAALRQRAGTLETEVRRLHEVVPVALHNEQFMPTATLLAELEQQINFAAYVEAFLALCDDMKEKLWAHQPNTVDTTQQQQQQSVVCDFTQLRSTADDLQSKAAELSPLYKSQNPIVKASIVKLHQIVHLAPQMLFLQSSASPTTDPNLWHKLLDLPREAFQHKVVVAVKAQNTHLWSVDKLLHFLIGEETAGGVTFKIGGMVENAMVEAAHAASLAAAAEDQHAKPTSTAKAGTATGDDDKSKEKGKKKK